MFKFYDSKPHFSSLFIGSAVCADEATRTAFQKGGFLYLTNIGKNQTPTANIPDPDSSTGINVLQRRLVYPVFIPRKQDTTNNFYPIQADGLVSYIDDTNYTGYVDTDSYYSGTGDSHTVIVAGDMLELANDTSTGSVAKLVASNATPALSKVVAICLAAPNADGEMKIKWLG
jgi:hypothetical protein